MGYLGYHLYTEAQEAENEAETSTPQRTMAKREETFIARKQKFCKMTKGCTIYEPFTYEKNTIFCKEHYKQCM